MGEVLATGAANGKIRFCSSTKMLLPAHIWFDAKVNPLVVFQVVQLEKCFRTKFTLVAAFGKVVSFHVVAQDGGELVLLIT